MAFLADLAKIADALEGVAKKLGGGGGGDGEGPAEHVVEYQQFYTNKVAPLVETCKGLPGKGADKLAKYTEDAFKRVTDLLEASTKCKKPSPEDLLAFLAPVQASIKGAGKIRDFGRELDYHQRAFEQFIQLPVWVMMEPPAGLPASHVKGQLESADFYLTKVLMTTKDSADKVKHRAFVAQIKELGKDLEAYIKDFHKAGISWNGKGGDLKSYTPGAAPQAAAAPEAATPQENTEASVLARLQEVTELLKKARVGGRRGGGGGGDEGDGPPEFVTEYQEFFKTRVTPLIETCKALSGKGADKLAKYTEDAFKNVGDLLENAAKCKKPSPEALMAFLAPAVAAIQGAGKIRDFGRELDFHQRSFEAFIQAVAWVTMEPPASLPAGHVKGQREAADFYLTKVLMTTKDKEDKATHRAFVKQIKELLTDLEAYVKDFHKTGVTYNPKGSDLPKSS